MAKTQVYIDGQSGTTGLQIYERLEARDDVDIIRISHDKRHDTHERACCLNAADVAFLCLPDDQARISASLVDNPHTVVIDASTAHRTQAGWTYGYPELNANQRKQIAASKRIANPGCHATGFISIVAPLVQAGIVDAASQLVCYSLTGYTGGGKKMIASYTAQERPQSLDAPGVYALDQHHKHIPEMCSVCGLGVAPTFMPVVGDFAQGMATTVMFTNVNFVGAQSLAGVRECLDAHYKGQRFVRVLAGGDVPSTLYANTNAGTNNLDIIVSGSDNNITVTALFDNLGKGASGAAIQNLNIALGLSDDYCLS